VTLELLSLGDICDFAYGASLPEAKRKAGPFPVYGSNGPVGWHNGSLTHGPTLIIGRKGSIGRVHYSSLPCFPIDTTYFVEETKLPCSLRWLYYLLNTLGLPDMNKGAAVPGLNRNDAYEKKLAFPPLAEQKRIAALLDKADRLRRSRRYVQELSDSFLQSVFLEMFGDPMTNPCGWDTATINDAVAASQYGTSKKNNPDRRGYPVLGMGNVSYSGRLLLDSLSYAELSVKEFEELQLIPGDVIFNRTNSTELVGKTTHWNCKTAAVLASYLIKLRLKDNVLPDFFVMLLNTTHYKKLFQERCKKAVGQSNISPTLLKEFPLYFPPLERQEGFAEVVRRMDRLRGQQREADRQAEHLFQTLLHRSFSDASGTL